MLVGDTDKVPSKVGAPLVVGALDSSDDCVGANDVLGATERVGEGDGN